MVSCARSTRAFEDRLGYPWKKMGDRKNMRKKEINQLIPEENTAGLEGLSVTSFDGRSQAGHGYCSRRRQTRKLGGNSYVARCAQ